MFDIDRALTDIKPKTQQPSERLRESTRQLVFQEIRKKESVKRSGKLFWVMPTVAAMLAAFVFLFTLPPAADEVSFITIDINPSISMQVDTSDMVLAVSAENDDASVLLQSLSLTGLQFKEALGVVVRAADEQGYLKEDGHVLVAHFGGTSTITQQVVEAVVAESIEHEVKVLLLQSSRETFDKAKALHQQPGVELLKKKASAQGINEQNVDRIIDRMGENVSEKVNSQEKPEKSNQEVSRPPSADVPGNNTNGKDFEKEQEEKEHKKDVYSNEETTESSVPQDKPKGAENGKSNGQTDNAADKNKGSNGDKNEKTGTADQSKNNKKP